jgi:hypothetical protein
MRMSRSTAFALAWSVACVSASAFAFDGTVAGQQDAAAALPVAAAPLAGGETLK